MEFFIIAMNQLFSVGWLDFLTKEEVRKIEESYHLLGFPGCTGVVSCGRLIWKNCPVGL